MCETELQVAEFAHVVDEVLGVIDLGRVGVRVSLVAKLLEQYGDVGFLEGDFAHGDEGGTGGFGVLDEVLPRVGIFVLEDNGGNFFGHVSIETAHAVASDERYHVVFERDEIVGLHAVSIVAESVVKRTRIWVEMQDVFARKGCALCGDSRRVAWEIMRAIQITQTGGPDVLMLRDLPNPTPGPGQALVQIEVCGVNFIDVYLREGRYPAQLPFVPGQEAAGTVIALGPDVASDSVKVGDRVVWCHTMGTYAEFAVAPLSKLIAIPESVSARQAAAAMLQGMTAHYLAYSTYAIQAGDTVLIHAGAGGVGLLLIQLAKRLGARVLTTVSTEEKAALAREAGADETILYTREDFATKVRELTGGKGVPVVYDSVGKTTFDGSLACLRPRGVMALYGGSSGAVPPFDLIQLSTKGSLYVTRPTLKDYTATRADLEQRAGDVLRWVAEGTLKLRLEHIYPLAEAAQAHRDLEARKTTGKVLLIP